MPEYRPFYQVDPTALIPFNEAPKYLRGGIRASLHELIIEGRAEYQMQAWHNLGVRSELLAPHSFGFAVSALPRKELGSYSVGLVGVSRINISHFLRSSVSLTEPYLGSNFYSGFGFDQAGHRTQTGVKATWAAVGRHHNLSLEYKSADSMLSCYANGLRVHQVRGPLGRFRLEIRFEAVGVNGDFDITFDNLSYFPLDRAGKRNIRLLRGWNPRFSPVFVSYSHSDSSRVSPLIDGLRRCGVRVLGDWELRVGDSLHEKLGDFIESAGCVLAFLSQAGVKSSWVKSELNSVLSQEKKRLLPILLEDCTLPFFLQDRLFLRVESSVKATVDRILGELQRVNSW